MRNRVRSVRGVLMGRVNTHSAHRCTPALGSQLEHRSRSVVSLGYVKNPRQPEPHRRPSLKGKARRSLSKAHCSLVCQRVGCGHFTALKYIRNLSSSASFTFSELCKLSITDYPTTRVRPCTGLAVGGVTTG